MDIEYIPVKKIKVFPKQSRQNFNEENIEQLAKSIEEVGQLQPVIVKKYDDIYLLIAGERRLRAIKKNKESKILAIILAEEVKEFTLRQIQLIENLQREDLNPLERAVSIRLFMKENDLSKKEASQKLGIPRTTLTEWLNILDVPEKYRQAVIDEDSPLSLSHITLAKALVSRTGDPTKLKQLLDGVLKYKLSRSETKEITEMFYKYLHLPMEEAFGAILLKRERQRLGQKRSNYKNKKDLNTVRSLLTSFNNVSHKLEEVMEEVGDLEEEDKGKILDEFLYVYQLVRIMVPELTDNKLDEMIEHIKEINLD